MGFIYGLWLSGSEVQFAHAQYRHSHDLSIRSRLGWGDENTQQIYGCLWRNVWVRLSQPTAMRTDLGKTLYGCRKYHSDGLATNACRPAMGSV